MIVHVALLEGHCDPVQPANVDPVAGMAVKVTAVPTAYLSLQSEPQAIPAGVLTIMPEPLPEMPTVSVNEPSMVNGRPFEAPPPGAGFTTVTVAVPAVARSAAGMLALTCVALRTLVVRAVPFHCTAAPLTKFVPPTVSVNAGPPAAALLGVKLVSVGTGFGAAVIVNVSGPDAPPPGAGFTTVTVAVPAVARSAAVMLALTCVALIKFVVRAVPFHCTAAPVSYTHLTLPTIYSV